MCKLYHYYTSAQTLLFLTKLSALSRHKERADKVCLNCHSTVQGRYCHVCGQENIEPKETAWNMLTHFFKDLMHFDGKFFSSLKLLVTRPGFLSREYMAGRRNSYLNPVKMYVFTSAFFFLVFFSFSKVSDGDISKTTINGKSLEEIDIMDSARFADFTREINRDDDKADMPMTRPEFERYKDSAIRKSGVRFTPSGYSSRAAYDSALQRGEKKHNWVTRQLVYKQLDLNKKYNNDSQLIVRAFMDKIMHSLPQMLFVSLPFFALLLKWLYIRTKNLYYVDHLVFTVHFYIFSFFAMFIMYAITKINNQLDLGIFRIVNFLLFICMLFYEYKAMRKFYLQSRGKTIAKFLLLNLAFIVFMVLIFGFFVIFSFFKI